jgi:hypothetical protein
MSRIARQSQYSGVAQKAINADNAIQANTSVSSSYAATASLLLGSVVSASYAATASLLLGSITSASYSATSSYSTTLGTSLSNTSEGTLRLINSANITISSITSLTASLANTASYVTPYEGVWRSYTPSWTAASINPSIGNGSLEGWYKVVGKTCFVRGNIVMGSTTTFGSGEWYVSMPFTASHADAILMTANLLDNGTAWYNAVLNGARAGFNYKAPIQYQGGAGTALDVNATQPYTWANSDRFLWNGSYEIA